jgi:hypothetical protein
VRLPTLERAKRLATKLVVLNQATKALEPFVFNDEQLAIVEAMLTTRRLWIGKGRQVGASTVCVYLVLLLAMMNPGLPCAIVADDQRKAEKLLAKATAWLKQLGRKPTVENVRRLELANGASIEALSAVSHAEEGESRVGRSGTYAVIHASEQAFWRNASAVWGALTATSPTIILNESTGAPGGDVFKKTMDAPGWRSLFVGVEMHVGYRSDPTSIDDSTWEEAKKRYGFTRRDTAAWWLRTLEMDKAGDESRMLRDFPVIPSHMWVYREGQHIQKWVEAKVTVDDKWEFYETPELDVDGTYRWTEPVLFGVDTAHGLGAKEEDFTCDASAIAIIGHKSGRALATFRSRTTVIPAFQAVIDAACARYVPVSVIVESNGPGAAVWQHVKMKHAGAVEHWSGETDGEVFERRDRLRAAIERGEVPVGGHLLDECGSSTIKAKRTPDGRMRPVFIGRDDTLSALSFARKWRDANAYREPPKEVDRDVVSIEALMRAKRAKDQVTW